MNWKNYYELFKDEPDVLEKFFRDNVVEALARQDINTLIEITGVSQNLAQRYINFFNDHCNAMSDLAKHGLSTDGLVSIHDMINPLVAQAIAHIKNPDQPYSGYEYLKEDQVEPKHM